jgi:hypothetical protein
MAEFDTKNPWAEYERWKRDLIEVRDKAGAERARWMVVPGHVVFALGSAQLSRLKSRCVWAPLLCGGILVYRWCLEEKLAYTEAVLRIERVVDSARRVQGAAIREALAGQPQDETKQVHLPSYLTVPRLPLYDSEKEEDSATEPKAWVQRLSDTEDATCTEVFVAGRSVYGEDVLEGLVRVCLPKSMADDVRVWICPDRQLGAHKRKELGALLSFWASNARDLDGASGNKILFEALKEVALYRDFEFEEVGQLVKPRFGGEVTGLQTCISLGAESQQVFLALVALLVTFSEVSQALRYVAVA